MLLEVRVWYMGIDCSLGSGPPFPDSIKEFKHGKNSERPSKRQRGLVNRPLGYVLYRTTSYNYI